MNKYANVALVVVLLASSAGFSDSAHGQGPLRQRLRQKFKERAAQSSGTPRNFGDAQYSQIAGLNVAIWLPPHANATAPLVIFSHGFRGMNVQSADLMRALANAGYLVIAPNHKDAITNRQFLGRVQEPLGRPDEWSDTTYRDRGDDIKNLLAALKADPHWNSLIDWNKVALVGHSLGGYTVLGTAGAWPNWKLDGIKAVVALSPYSHPFNRKGDLAHLNIPVMYQTGTTDIGVGPFLKGRNGSYTKTSSPAELVVIKGANHFTWTNLNKQKSKEDLIEHYCISFLNKFVRGDGSANPAERLPGVTDLEVK